MYTVENFPSKAALKRAVAAGDKVAVWQPGPFNAQTNGAIALEGPHFPKPHTWYATATIRNSVILKGTVR